MAGLHSNSECFSWAVLSTAQEKYYFLCALCVSSEAGGEISQSNIVLILTLMDPRACRVL
jgi:hypothetical protein